MPDVGIDWDGFRRDNDRTRDVIERVIPGFEDFNERVREPGGFVLPNPPRDTRSFATPSGRARFSINHHAGNAVPPGSLLLQTIMSHDQYNTTIYGLSARYRGNSSGHRVGFGPPAHLTAHGLDAVTP